MKIDLNGKWKLYYYETDEYEINHPSQLTNDISNIPCTVPGNVELDLSAAGILPEDLIKGENILLAEKYETYEWWYETEFDGVCASNEEEIFLNFEAVDCIAEYFLNGELIGKSDNMFLPNKFNVTDKLLEKNTLHVKIKSALLAEQDMETTAFAASAEWHTYDMSTQIRKAAHSYGWDIMPRAISAGIWRGVSLEVCPKCRFSQLFFATKSVVGDTADLRMIFDVKLPHKYCNKNLRMSVYGECGDSSFAKEIPIKFKSGNMGAITVKNPKLWWPYGYGEPNLYKTTVKLFSDDTVIAEETMNVGIRTVRLVAKDTIDCEENCFKFVINNVDIVCKGSNWVPMDAYHSRDRERYAKALELVKDIGCNILRCWGGNVYEDQCFFDFCDENGIMVWQDFGMGCFNYPKTEEFYKKITDEATTVVKMLRHHPSIILWCGDNECDIIQRDFGVGVLGINHERTNKVTREILPMIVASHDMGRPYLKSSPYVSEEVFKTQRYDLMPEDHMWGPRDYYKSRFYSESKASFVSETGYHGSPSVESIKKFIDEEYWWPCSADNKQWILHSADQNGDPSRMMLMVNQIKQMFDETLDNLDEFCLASQISQAEAVKYFIERVRIMPQQPGGIIWWNLIDGWPQFSDAVVDYYYDKKLAYDYIKRCQAPFCIICGENNDMKLPLYAVNDTLTKQNGHFSVSDGETGEILLEGDYNIAENTRVKLGEIHADYSEKRLIMIRWDGGYNHYISGNIPFDLEKSKEWHEIIKKG